MSPYKKAEALVSQVCLDLFYSCAVGVKSAAASLRLLSPGAGKQVGEIRHTQNKHTRLVYIHKRAAKRSSIHPYMLSLSREFW